MNVIKTDIEGVLIIEPRFFRDARAISLKALASESLKRR